MFTQCKGRTRRSETRNSASSSPKARRVAHAWRVFSFWLFPGWRLPPAKRQRWNALKAVLGGSRVSRRRHSNAANGTASGLAASRHKRLHRRSVPEPQARSDKRASRRTTCSGLWRTLYQNAWMKTHPCLRRTSADAQSRLPGAAWIGSDPCSLVLVSERKLRFAEFSKHLASPLPLPTTQFWPPYGRPLRGRGLARYLKIRLCRILSQTLNKSDSELAGARNEEERQRLSDADSHAAKITNSPRKRRLATC